MTYRFSWKKWLLGCVLYPLVGAMALAQQCDANRLSFTDIHLPGLSPNTPVSGINVDTMGRLWLSTENGVVMYDGIRSFPLRYQPNDKQSLAFPIGNSVVETENLFIIQHDARFNTLINKRTAHIQKQDWLLDRRTWPLINIVPEQAEPVSFIAHRPYVLGRQLAASHDDPNILVLSRHASDGNNITLRRQLNIDLQQQGRHLSRLLTHGDRLLALTFQRAKDVTQPPNLLVQTNNQSWQSLAELDSPLLIADAFSNGTLLYVLGMTSQHSVMYVYDEQFNLLSRQILGDYALFGSFQPDANNQLWLLLANQSLYQLCAERAIQVTGPVALQPDNGIHQKSAWDNQHNFWLAKANGGLGRFSVLPAYLQLYNQQIGSLPTNNTRKALPYKQDQLIVLTQDAGVYVVEKASGKAIADITPKTGMTGWRDVYIDNNALWLSGYHGLWIKQGDTAWQQLSAEQSFSLVPYQTTVWQLTVNGVYNWPKAAPEKPLQHLLPNMAVRALLPAEGKLYAASHSHLQPLNQISDTGSIQTLNPNGLNNYPFTLLRVNEGMLYGSWGDGLQLLNETGEVLFQLTEKQGLPSNIVYGVVEDSYQRLWLSTDRGLAVVQRCATSLNCFEVTDILNTERGLLCNEFDSESHFLADDGIAYFGGLCGVVAVNTHLYQGTAPAITPYLSFINVNGQPIEGSSAFVAPFQGSNWVIAPGEEVKLGFSGNPYRQLQALQYRLNNGDWQKLAAPYEINFTQLAYGQNQLIVQAIDSRGNVNGDTLALTLAVKTPWYATKLAWFSYLCMVLFVALFTYRTRQRVLLIRNEQLQRQVNEQTAALGNANLALHNNLQQHQKMVEYLSHELRTPLSLMLLPMQQLEPQLSGKQKQLLQQAELAGQRLHGFIDQLLQLGEHIDFSKQPAVYVDIPTVVQQLVESYQPLAHAKQQQLLISGDLGSKTGYWQRQSLEIILSNLLSNAIKHCPLAAVIQVKLSYHNAMLHLQVCDNGTGIAEAEQEVIFEKHQRASTQAPGNGLGLAIVKTLCQQLGGEIKLLPQAQGSCFEVRLPILEHTAPQQPLSHQPLKALGNRLVLLAEDEPALRQQLSRGLQSHFTVLSAADGEEAWQLIQQQLPDLVISDVQMPKRSGTELCQLVKQHDTTSHIPVLLLSAWASTEHQRSGLQAQADDYLTKPIHLDLLLHKVTNLLSTLEAQAIKLQHAIISGNPEDSTKVLAQTSPQSKPERLLNQTRQFIEQQIQQGNGLSLSSQLLAEQANLSEKQLNRYCQQRCQCSLSDLISLSKLRYAAQLLANPALNIAQVSEQAGFSSQAYFSKVFKAQYGKTPGEYRRQ